MLNSINNLKERLDNLKPINSDDIIQQSTLDKLHIEIKDIELKVKDINNKINGLMIPEFNKEELSCKDNKCTSVYETLMNITALDNHSTSSDVKEKDNSLAEALLKAQPDYF